MPRHLHVRMRGRKIRLSNTESFSFPRANCPASARPRSFDHVARTLRFLPATRNDEKPKSRSSLTNDERPLALLHTPSAARTVLRVLAPPAHLPLSRVVPPFTSDPQTQNNQRRNPHGIPALFKNHPPQTGVALPRSATLISVVQ